MGCTSEDGKARRPVAKRMCLAMIRNMEINHFKDKLEAALKTVEAELKTVGVQNPKNPADWEAKDTETDSAEATADPNEHADKLEEYEGHQAITDELEVRYNDIKAALKKIEDGTYGKCEVSGESIELDRLEATPAARTCKQHMSSNTKS